MRELRGDIADFLGLLRDIARGVEDYVRRIAKEGPRTELVVTVGWHLHNFYTALEE